MSDPQTFRRIRNPGRRGLRRQLEETHRRVPVGQPKGIAEGAPFYARNPDGTFREEAARFDPVGFSEDGGQLTRVDRNVGQAAREFMRLRREFLARRDPLPGRP